GGGICDRLEPRPSGPERQRACGATGGSSLARTPVRSSTRPQGSVSTRAPASLGRPAAAGLGGRARLFEDGHRERGHPRRPHRGVGLPGPAARSSAGSCCVPCFRKVTACLPTPTRRSRAWSGPSMWCYHKALPLAAGTRLGSFVIVAPVGAGGMGEVYKAHDPRLHRDVAIKVLPADRGDDADRIRRFEQGTRAVAALTPPGIASLSGIGRDDGVGYRVTELLEGETLRQRLARGALPARKAVELVRQVAEALAAAHERGIAHRDLKPENLVITRDGRVKILHFGLARFVGPLADVASTLA